MNSSAAHSATTRAMTSGSYRDSGLDRLLTPRSVAIVGASADATKTASRPLAYVTKHGFGGAVYPVNPRVSEIDGMRCYPSTQDLPEVPDVAVVVLGPEGAIGAMRELSELGVGAAIVLGSGYAEVGADGQHRQAELLAAAGTMRVLGPNSIGVVNITDHTVLSASLALELGALNRGSIAVVSQSGGVLGSLLSRGQARGLGFSKLVATGNEADIQLVDVIDWLIDDDATAVIALYIEGLREPERFRQVAWRAREARKPLVVYKVGRSEAGSRSASSHTGVLAGSDRVYDAFLAQCGAIRVTSFSDLSDVPATISAGRRLSGKRLGILTTTGGGGVLVADACGMAGFVTPDPDPETARSLAGVMVGGGAVPDRNPVDLTLTGLKPSILAASIRALLESPEYDVVAVVVGASAHSDPHLAFNALVDARETTDKPLIAFVSPHAPDILSRLNRHGIPTFDAPEACATALSALDLLEQPWSVPHARPNPEVVALPAVSGPLNEAESEALFARFGIPTVDAAIAFTPAEAGKRAQSFTGDLVLKVLARNLPHKTERGGVIVGVPAELVEERSAELLRRVRSDPKIRIDGILLQEQIVGGAEYILGFVRDEQFGPVILFGSGGSNAEVFDDVAIRLAPLNRPQARDMIESIKSYALLVGFRDAPHRDLEALIDCVVAFSDMVIAIGDRLVEAEINPLFVLPEGQGVQSADGLVVLR